MRKTFRQKLRKNMESSFYKKGIFFWILSPFFCLISLLISYFAWHRRKKSYAISKTPLKTICIGNIIIGGTGKSPVVQKIALYYLKKGFIVAIASRGIGKNIQNIFLSNHDVGSKISFLSDENREHFEILKHFSNSGSLFYILQNKKRNTSLKYFISEVKRLNKDLSQTVFILDDGLQHFSCPRNLNICLWDPFILMHSPPYAMPLGPYREGFGEKSFHYLLETFHFRFWSRTKEDSIDSFQKNISESLKYYGVSLSNKDTFVTYNNIFWNVFVVEKEIYLQSTLSGEDVKNKVKDFENIGIVVGIAHPEKFISDLLPFLKENKKQTLNLFLDDHAPLTEEAFMLIQKSDLLLFTLKDLLRWSSDFIFLEIVKNKKIIACCVDVEFYDLALKKIEDDNSLLFP